jgi:lambda family phage portal protein
MTPLSRFIDYVVEQVSPARAARRQYYRAWLQGSRKGKREQYAAAKSHRLSGGWTVVPGGLNDLIANSGPAIRQRVRQLVRDFPYFARAINCVVDYVVGPGIMFQSRAVTESGDLNKAAITAIEDSWKWWKEEADTAGKLHFDEIMRLMKRQDVESGEFILVKAYPKGRYVPFSLSLYEADWLTENSNPKFGGMLKQGIEYLEATGEVLAYHLSDPDDYRNVTVVRASQVIHGFDTVRPQQLRGVSPFAPAVILADDLENYMGAEIDAAKLAAKYLAFIETPDPAGMQSGRLTYEENSEGVTKPLEEMENAIIEYLQPGERVDIAKHERPGTTFQPFVKFVLTMLSVGTGVPYELLTGDYQGLNFSTARICRNDWSQMLRPIAVRHIRQFCDPVFRAFLDMAVLSGRITLPGYFNNPRLYWEREWQPPGMVAVDPLRESKSQIESIDYGLKSQQEVARERGRDLEDIYREIKAARDMAKEYGLEFVKPSTAVSNNPAAINKESEEE